MRIASIDLGTNTFNLLIAETGNTHFKIIYKDKRPVKLGKGGINKHTIQPDAWIRGMEALSDYHLKTDEFKVDKIIATATSAIRCADNGQEFVNEVKSKLGIQIVTINGKEEARLIFEGVRHAIPQIDEPYLVMDIGGGSVEFIIAHQNEIKWHNSFEIGIARMLDIINPSDPITSEEISHVEKFLNERISTAIQAAVENNIKTLVGSSGSFDAIANMASFQLCGKPSEITRTCFEIPIDIFHSLHKKLLTTTLKERSLIPGMDLMRIEMIVLGSTLINLVCSQLGITKIIQSEYAIKEGVILNSLKND